MDRYLTRVRRKLNWLVFLGQLSERSFLVPAVVALPLLGSHLLLRQPYPVLGSLLGAAVLLSGWAAWRAWQLRYRDDDVRALADSWLGGRGDLLVGTGTGSGPVPGTKLRRLAAQWLPTVCAVMFLTQVPVLPRANPDLVTHNTARLAQQIQELQDLALLSAPRQEELKSLLGQLEQSAHQMSTTEFWQANDQFQAQLDKALAESQAGFETAAAELAKLATATPGATMPGTEAGLATDPKALENLLRALPAALAGQKLSPGLAEKLQELLKQTQPGDPAKLAEALKQLSPAELQQLADQLGQRAGQCQANRAGTMPGQGDSLAGLDNALAELDQAGYQELLNDREGEGSGTGGVNRGPGTNRRLFGQESPELQAALQNALLPGTGAADPGQVLEKTQIPTAPHLDKTQWNQARPLGVGQLGAPEAASGAAVIAPRYRGAVNSYFAPK